MSVKLNEKFIKDFVDSDAIEKIAPEVEAALETVKSGTGAGADFLGWYTRPVDYDKDEYARIKDAAARIRKNSDVLIVIGIGGSYLGARSAIEFVKGNMHNATCKDDPQVFFAGNSISASALSDLLKACEGKDISLNVVSKSGTTTEPAVAFRIFRELLIKKYGEEGARERIFCTTDKCRGKLKEFSDKCGYETFVVPDDIGGRYSVLTAVGLLPIAVAGIDIDAMMQGAADAMEAYKTPSAAANDCLKYAAYRNLMYRAGKTTEILVSYEPSLQMYCEWWKQLYGESEGKDGKGIFPASVDLTPDLHSMGQYIQDGIRMLQETVVFFDNSRTSVTVPSDEENLDGLNYLAGREMSYINEKAMQATKAAHISGGVPVTEIRLPEIGEEALGALIYFFEFACGVSGYMEGVNPFNQPGVEAYKKNMFHLLGKPGY